MLHTTRLWALHVVHGAWLMAACTAPTCPAGTSLVDGRCAAPTSADPTTPALTCSGESADCDGDPSNGCEVNLRDNPDHCGACGRTCAWACGGLMCNDPVQVAAGGEHTCMLRQDGTVWCWGRNVNPDSKQGMLGDGSSVAQRLFPVPVLGVDGQPLRDVRKISVGSWHGCALRADSTLHCWGDNGFGKLGIGSQNDQSQAVAVAGLGASNLQLTGVSDVALGIDHSCAVLDTGNVVCWGGNFLYELGADPPVPGANDNFSTRPIAATKVNELLLIHGRVTAMGAGRNQSTCVVTEQGKGICWGFDRYNQTGHGEVPLNDALRAPDLVTEVGDRFSPATELSEIQVGQFSACARKQSGRLMCWGYGLHGDVGNGVDLRFTPLPAQLGSKDSYHTAQWVVTPGFGAGGPPLEGVRALAEGEGDHQCAVLDDARGVCWGYNADGRLGNGKSGSFPFGTGTVVEAEATPTYVAGLDGAEHLTGIVQMTRGFAHTCALLDTGHVACWGQGDFGRLGNGSTEVQARPVRVAFPGGPAAQ